MVRTLPVREIALNLFWLRRYPAVILKTNDRERKVLVHFVDWTSQWDECARCSLPFLCSLSPSGIALDASPGRLAPYPLRTKTMPDPAPAGDQLPRAITLRFVPAGAAGGGVAGVAGVAGALVNAGALIPNGATLLAMHSPLAPAPDPAHAAAAAAPAAVNSMADLTGASGSNSSVGGAGVDGLQLSASDGSNASAGMIGSAAAEAPAAAIAEASAGEDDLPPLIA